MSNYQFCVFIEPENKKLKERYEYAAKQKQENGLCVPSTIEIECDTNVFMRTGNKTLQDNLKKYWNEAGKDVIGKVPKKYAVKVGETTDKWTEADIIGALRHLKTSGYHKKAKIQRRSKIYNNFIYFFCVYFWEFVVSGHGGENMEKYNKQREVGT